MHILLLVATELLEYIVSVQRGKYTMLEKNSHASIIEKVRNQNNVITSKNCPELAKRIKELSKEFMVKNAELYKRLETR